MTPKPRRVLPASIDFGIVSRVLGWFAILFSLTMLLPIVIDVWQGATFESERGNTLHGFLVATAVGLAAGVILVLAGRRSSGEFFRREGILTVAFVWLLVGLLGALPFYFAGWLNLSDGFFESVSGLTTTGSSVLGATTGDRTPAISTMPPSLLFWRSWLHWCGGLGIVVMFLAFLPALGITEKTLFQAEVAGVSKEGLRPRIRHSTVMLFRIYTAITAALCVAYLAFGMTLFEAINHAFATIATGGFSTRNYSVGEFNSVAIEMIATVGMFMAATNFSLYHRAALLFRPAFRTWYRPNLRALPRPRTVLRAFFCDPEFRVYFGIFVVVVIVLAGIVHALGTSYADAANIGRDHDYPGSVLTCLRDTGFQTASLVSSTGFANSNLLSWPFLAQTILIAVMLCGGCSGSTGGGLKVARVTMLFKMIARSLRRFLRPRSVEPLRFGRSTVDIEVADRVVALAATWMLILILGSVILLALEPSLDILTSFSSMVTALCNMGPAFAPVLPGSGAEVIPGIPDIGSYGTFGYYSPVAKVFMAFVMILGRLEVYTALIILFPSFWKD